MRKTLGLLCAAALMLPVGVIAAAPAGAAGGTACAKANGTATFKPPIPPGTTQVKPKVSATGTVSGCTAGGVKSGKTTFKQTSASKAVSYATIANLNATIKGTFTIKWNTGKSSVSKSFSINAINGKISGKITSGPFVGKAISATLATKVPTGTCVTKPVSKIPYTIKSGTKFVIK